MKSIRNEEERVMLLFHQGKEMIIASLHFKEHIIELEIVQEKRTRQQNKGNKEVPNLS